ncbi:hypothetical protein [Micromonospora sp. NPDC048843]
MKVVLPGITVIEVLRRCEFTYTAILPVREATVSFLSGLLHVEGQRLATRDGTRSLGCFKQAALVIRWMVDGTRISQLAKESTVSRPTGCAYLLEGLTELSAQAPGLHSVLLAVKMAGYAHVSIDGHTDRDRSVPRPRAAARGGSVAVGQARQPRGERAEQHCSGRVAVSLEHRPDHRRSPGFAPHRPRPHDVITQRHQPLLGKAQWP